MTTWLETLQTEVQTIARAQVVLLEAVRAAGDVANIPIRELQCHGAFAIGRIWTALDALDNARLEAERILERGER